MNVHAEAHADVLLGATEPGGRLPVPITGDGGRVVCPLGHGAGYTSVEYSHLRIAPDRGPGPPQLVVQCRVTNAGDRVGKEVVQVYLRNKVHLGRPHPEQAWPRSPGRARARPHRHRHAPHRRRPARRVEPADAPLVVEPGTFTVFVGRSAADLRLRGTVVVDSAADLTD